MRLSDFLTETPIEPTDNPNNPVVKHGKANAMELNTRIMQTRSMLKELAARADGNDLATWESICKLALGGGWTMGLVQNLEQIQHGIEELAKLRRQGGVRSRGIDPNIGEAKATKQRLDPKCWTGHHKEGTKVKGGVRVNNCVPNKE
jgi:hypothetical protein